MTSKQKKYYHQMRRESFFYNWIMDGIAIYFIGRALFPVLKYTLDGFRLSFFVLPIWLFMAYRKGGAQQLWNLTKSKGFLAGILGYSFWIVFERIIQRSPDADRDFRWLIITALPIYLMSCFYGYLQPFRFWRIAWILLALLGIQAAYSVPFLISGVWNAKMVMNGVDATTIEGKLYMVEAALHGIGGYDLYMNTAVLVSIIGGTLFYERKRWFPRLFWAFSWISVLLASAVSTFSASALVATFGTSILLIVAIVRRKLAFSSLLILILIVGLVGVFAFEQVSSSDQYLYSSEKLLDIFRSVDDGGLQAETTGRGERIFMSFNAFLQSPFIGYGAEGALVFINSKGGGHSTWLNTLVEYGVLGGFWFFLMVVSVGIQILKAVKKQPGNFLGISLLVTYITFLIYGIINVVMMDVVFFFFLFGGALALQKQSEMSKHNF